MPWNSYGRRVPPLTVATPFEGLFEARRPGLGASRGGLQHCQRKGVSPSGPSASRIAVHAGPSSFAGKALRFLRNIGTALAILVRVLGQTESALQHTVFPDSSAHQCGAESNPPARLP